MEENNLKLIDIYDISYHPWWLRSWFIGVLVCLGVVLLFCVGFWLYRKYKKQPVMPYWQVTLQKLETLKKCDTQDGQLFYLALTDALKQYLQERYQIALLDKTDTELLEVVRNDQKIPALVSESLKDILDGVMVIKFAHEQALKERMDDAIEQSIKLVQTTVLKEKK